VTTHGPRQSRFHHQRVGRGRCGPRPCPANRDCAAMHGRRDGLDRDLALSPGSAAATASSQRRRSLPAMASGVQGPAASSQAASEPADPVCRMKWS